jgi:pilus assembly protein CpaB
LIEEEFRMRRKWSPAARWLAAIGVLLSVATFLLVQGYAQKARSLSRALGSPAAVVVAAGDLPRGAMLDPSMLRSVSYPETYVPPNAVLDARDVTGRVLLAPLAENEPLTEARLAPEGAGPVASLVPEGLRAVTVDASFPANSIRPGDRVDVLATFGGGRPYTETTVTGAEVLVVSTQSDTSPVSIGGTNDSASASALILLVSPDDAERLAYAGSFADLSIAVAGPEEVLPR